MATITLSKQQAILAIEEESHEAGSVRTFALAVDWDDNTARIITCDTPSMMGGYFSNNVGEENYDLDVLTDPNHDLKWNEDNEDYDRESVLDWIEQSLLDTIDLNDEWVEVNYI